MIRASISNEEALFLSIQHIHVPSKNCLY